MSNETVPQRLVPGSETVPQRLVRSGLLSKSTLVFVVFIILYFVAGQVRLAWNVACIAVLYSKGFYKGATLLAVFAALTHWLEMTVDLSTEQLPSDEN